jgi:hypothetical protein
VNESEWQTRKQRIDTRLRSLSPAWEIVPWHAGLDLTKLRRHIVTEIPAERGRGGGGMQRYLTRSLNDRPSSD